MAVLLAAGGAVWASPAFAAPMNITTDPEWEGGCDTAGNWTFSIDGVAGSTGVEPPASITAELVDGGTVQIPVTEVIGDPASPSAFPYNRATYVLNSPEKLSGVATAVIDDAWEPVSGFTFLTGPCVDAGATAALASPLAVQGNAFTVAGKVTSTEGEPLAGRRLQVRMHSAEALGKGRVFDVQTDASGQYELSVPATALGWHGFTVTLCESSPGTGFGEFGEDLPQLVGWSVPSSVPEAAGTLASSAGTAFDGATVLSGASFAPNSDVAIVMYSTPELLATTTTDESGALAVEVILPAGVDGQHTLVAVGQEPDGAARFLALPVTVQASAGTGGELPVTGGLAGMVAGVGVALLGLGVIGWLAARRRRVRFTTS